MADIQDMIIDGVVSELDEGASVGVASPSVSPLGGGPGTSSMNYGPGTSQLGVGVGDLNGGTGTRPLPIGGGVDQDLDRLAKVGAQVKVDRAEADASYRRFCSGAVAPSGRVPGLTASDTE